MRWKALSYRDMLEDKGNRRVYTQLYHKIVICLMLVLFSHVYCSRLHCDSMGSETLTTLKVLVELRRLARSANPDPVFKMARPRAREVISVKRLRKEVHFS